jgi:hypothetical protein
MLHNPNWNNAHSQNGREALRHRLKERSKLIAQSLDALAIAAMFRKSGDHSTANLFVAMSQGYMAAARKLT